MFKKQCFLKIQNFSTFSVSKQRKINLEMLRNCYEKATILLLFAKTLAEKWANINKIEAKQGCAVDAFLSRIDGRCGFFLLGVEMFGTVADISNTSQSNAQEGGGQASFG